MLSVLGFIVALAFALCNLPVLIDVAKGNKKGATKTYLSVSLVGNVASFSYVLIMNFHNGFYQIPLYINYSIATITLVAIAILKFKK